MSGSNSRKIAVITGASSGIGAVYADRLAGRGYDLILVARRADRLEALSAKISSAHGAKIEVIVADLENEADITRVEKVISANPAVHVLVNNAGIARLRPFGQAHLEDALGEIALNVTALTRLTHAILPAFLSRNDGVIINIASVLALRSLPISSVYSGTKGFVLNFSRGLQEELAKTNVRVQVVLPASTATEIWNEKSVPLSALPPETVMTAETMVDAALAGLDSGEAVTLPSVADAGLWEKYDTARSTLFAATQTGKPAPRYKMA
jgi:uncharacterized protein